MPTIQPVDIKALKSMLENVEEDPELKNFDKTKFVNHSKKNLDKPDISDDDILKIKNGVEKYKELMAYASW